MKKYEIDMDLDVAFIAAGNASKEEVKTQYPAACMALANEVMRLRELVATMPLTFGQQWINASDRKPTEEDADDDGCVLNLCRDDQGIAYSDQNPWHQVLDGEYWLPIPKHPKDWR